MTTPRRTSREEYLRRLIQKLAQRIERLQAASRRFVWLRLGVLLLGAALTWAALSQGGSAAGWGAFAAATLAFVLVVSAHRRLARWIERFAIYRALKAGQLARLTLDWENIPTPGLSLHRRSALAIDLDLTGERSLHQLLDTTISTGGSRLLADWLTQPTPDLGLIRRNQDLARELLPLARFRDRLLLNFRLASQADLEGENLLSWLGAEYPSDRLRRALPAAMILAAINLTLFGLSVAGLIPAYWVASAAIYLLFYYSNLSAVNPFLEAIVLLDGELDQFRAIIRYLEAFPYAGTPKLAELCAPFLDREDLPSARLRRVKLVTAGVGLRMNPVLNLMLNLLVPWDMSFAYLADRQRESLSAALPVWLETWYHLEALISLASYAHLNPEYIFPEISPSAPTVYEAVALGHPLLPPDRRVCNDFKVDELGSIIVITGSNMAGKSTFIKTIGVNQCLAYAGGPVSARLCRSLPFRLHSCIRITDSIVDGFSYFYAEVSCLKKLLEAYQEPGQAPMLYLIDEIFRGTNNRERLIGSRAYLNALVGGNGIGFLATHDLELASLAEQSTLARNFHFRDEVQEGRLAFDYQIRPGPSPTTNALKIMRLEGLPVEGES